MFDDLFCVPVDLVNAVAASNPHNAICIFENRADVCIAEIGRQNLFERLLDVVIVSDSFAEKSEPQIALRVTACRLYYIGTDVCLFGGIGRYAFAFIEDVDASSVGSYPKFSCWVNTYGAGSRIGQTVF